MGALLNRSKPGIPCNIALLTRPMTSMFVFCLLACSVMVHAGFPTVYESSNGFLEATLRVEVATVALKFKNISFQTRTYNVWFLGQYFVFGQATVFASCSPTSSIQMRPN